jgi:hypothetical protein
MSQQIARFANAGRRCSAQFRTWPGRLQLNRYEERALASRKKAANAFIPIRDFPE